MKTLTPLPGQKEGTVPNPSETNPFRSRHQWTHSTPEGLTTSGIDSSRLTETSLIPMQWQPGNSDEQMWRQEPLKAPMQPGRTWNTSLPLIEGLHSILDDPPMGRSWPESMQIGTTAYTPHILGWNDGTYGTAPAASSAELKTSFDAWSSLIRNTTMRAPDHPFEEFQYD
ncbi:hypothetical protein ARMGADRAFT_1071375 [Armillaria gallica]|uniref:Uncharacterized protein n=1 Tax=Armillaria gallica TaxID=47427 RepID=A0A2H3E356_ARMGA|nr:hypothetical protein ARMGADRAFT_1071375 [Armillaria gallica]